MYIPTLLLAAATSVSTAPAGAVRVEKDTTTLPEVTLSAPSKINVDLIPLNTNIVTSAEIASSAESSLLPVMTARVPGLFTTERGMAGYGVSGGSAGTVNIRGVGQGNKVLFMIDGQPQWAGVFGHSVADTYVANGVERIEVVKGPSSMLYGSNAMGGSVNIITRRAQKDGFYGRARAMFGSYYTSRFDMSAGVKKGKFGATAAASLDRSDGNRAGSAFWNANEFLQLQYNPDRHWEAGANVDMTQTSANNPGTLQAPLEGMWTRVFRGTGSVYAKNHYGVANGGIQGYINWGRNKVDDGWTPGNTPTDYLFNSTDYNMGFTLYETLNLWRDNDLSAGIDFQHWGGHNWNTGKADPTQISSEYRGCENEVAGYVMMQQGFWHDVLSVNAGVRLQHGSQYGNEWVPQAGAILRAFAGNSLKFSFSKGFRSPNLRELYLYPPHNPDLRPEYMWNYDVELRQSLLGGRLDMALSLFFINGRDMIQTVMLDGRPKNMNTGRFINKGIEFEASYAIDSDWQVAANYSYLHSTNDKIVGAPKNKINAWVDYNPGALSLTLESNTIWGLYTGGPRLQSYELLNLRGGYTFRQRGVHIKPFVKLDNILNKHYEILYGCPMPGITVEGGVELSF